MNRWEAAEAVEREEALSSSTEDRWRRLNTFCGMALASGILNENESKDDEVVIQRWAGLRKLG